MDKEKYVRIRKEMEDVPYGSDKWNRLTRELQTEEEKQKEAERVFDFFFVHHELTEEERKSIPF